MNFNYDQFNEDDDYCNFERIKRQKPFSERKDNSKSRDKFKFKNKQKQKQKIEQREHY